MAGTIAPPRLPTQGRPWAERRHSHFLVSIPLLVKENQAIAFLAFGDGIGKQENHVVEDLPPTAHRRDLLQVVEKRDIVLRDFNLNADEPPFRTLSVPFLPFDLRR